MEMLANRILFRMAIIKITHLEYLLMLKEDQVHLGEKGQRLLGKHLMLKVQVQLRRELVPMLRAIALPLKGKTLMLRALVQLHLEKILILKENIILKIQKNLYANIIGNGQFNKRSNAHTLDWQGNAWYSGDVYVGSTSGTDKDKGSKKLATEEYVDNHRITIDTTLSSTSENPVQNKVVKKYVDDSIKAIPVDGTTIKFNGQGQLTLALSNANGVSF